MIISLSSTDCGAYIAGQPRAPGVSEAKAIR
jgi:hypothetical protein